MWHDPIATDFAEALLNPSLAKPASLIGPNGKAANKRFNVYRNNVAYSLVEALGKNYPAVKAQCGDARFTDAALLYLGEHPPRSKMMFNLGNNFADWLDDFAPAKTQMPWLADLARAERAWLNAYHAADANPLDPNIFNAVAPDALGDVRFVKHPAAFVMCSQYSVHAMLEAGRNSLTTPAHIGSQDILITRPEFSVEMRLLPEGTGAFFQHIVSGGTLGEAAEAAFAQNPSFDFSACLGVLFQSGATTALA